VFLEVDALSGRRERLGSLSAEVHHALRLGGPGPNPLKPPKELLHLGPIAWGSIKGHLHRRLAVAGPVLDLRQVGHRLHEHLDVLTAAAADHVSDLLRGGPDRVPVKAGDDF
jgi:hypothetical protein